MKKSVIKTAFINAFATILYIVAITLFLSYEPKFIGSDKGELIIPVIMLSLLVFSAAVTGFLVFGRPVMWYLDGRKKESLSLLFCTLGIFLGIVSLMLIVWLIV